MGLSRITVIHGAVRLEFQLSIAHSLHDLRGSYCTNLSRSIPMHVVQELAGHSDIRTTRRYYVKVQPELMDETRKVLAKAIAS